MPLDVNDILRTTVCFLDPDGSQIQNVWWHRVLTAAPASDADAVTAVISDISQIYGQIDSNYPVGTTVNFVLIDKVSWEIDSWRTQYTVGIEGDWGSWVPAAAADRMSPAVAALVRMNTLLRKHSGRKYFGPFTEGENSAAGRIGAGMMTALSGVHTAILNAMNFPAGGGSIAVVVPNMSGFATNEINSCVSNNIWRSQRRRQPGVGI